MQVYFDAKKAGYHFTAQQMSLATTIQNYIIICNTLCGQIKGICLGILYISDITLAWSGNYLYNALWLGNYFYNAL